MIKRIPRVTLSLLIANIAIFLFQPGGDQWLILNFALWPLAGSGPEMTGGSSFMPWQLVSYAFLHGGLAHLFFNMFALHMFGSELERVFGSRRYLTYYMVCVMTAGLVQLIVALLSTGPAHPTVGASGGVFGLLLAYGLCFPRRTLVLIFPPIPMPAWLFVTLFGLIELFLGVTGTLAGIAHFAHLGGMLGGFLLIWYWRRRLPRDAQTHEV